jgi:hypothetical protein
VSVSDADLVWLETVELPPLSWATARRYQDLLGPEPRPPDPLLDAIDECRNHFWRIDRLDFECADGKVPIAERERIARAYFRIAAWEALASNELNESQKAWAVTQCKTKKSEPERILGAWIASVDPHAKLVGALREQLPGASAVDVARVVEKICDGWIFAVPGRASKAQLKTAVKRCATLAATDGVVDAVLQWLPAVPDFERRVVHAGTVLAADGSERCATALRPVLAEAPDCAWVVGIWSQLAPKGSPVAALLGAGSG